MWDYLYLDTYLFTGGGLVDAFVDESGKTPIHVYSFSSGNRTVYNAPAQEVIPDERF
jgi:hypothetical protein